MIKVLELRIVVSDILYNWQKVFFFIKLHTIRPSQNILLNTTHIDILTSVKLQCIVTKLYLFKIIVFLVVFLNSNSDLLQIMLYNDIT